MSLHYIGKKYQVNYEETLKRVFNIVITTLVMVIVLLVLKHFIPFTSTSRFVNIIIIAVYAVIGAIIYFAIIFKTKLIYQIFGKENVDKILNKFKKEEIDILIGTQMVVKGHDFPNVTLVGVIAADSSLNIDDYRAHERTFQTLTQVAGRAVRGKDRGRVIIQIYNPDSFCIQYAQKQDYKVFFNTEIMLRK